MPDSLIPCVGAVVRDPQGRLLMIKRGREPGAGLWSIPGGRIEPGETDDEALVREMLEETNLTVEVGRLLGRVQRPGLDGAVIDIRDYAVTVIGGTLRPGDDAEDARWVPSRDLDSLEVTEGLIEALTGWGVFGPQRQSGHLFREPAMTNGLATVTARAVSGGKMDKRLYSGPPFGGLS